MPMFAPLFLLRDESTTEKRKLLSLFQGASGLLEYHFKHAMLIPLAAVRRVREKGNLVQFGPKDEDHFIKTVKSEENIWLRQERGRYIMEASLGTR